MKYFKIKNKGFTLIELLVVIAIISLLSSIVFASLSSSRARGRYANVITQMKNIENAVTLYYNTTGSYPADKTGGEMPDGLLPYIPVWPTPPCSGWKYDWEQDHGDGIWWVGISRVTLRRADNQEIYYYCVNTTTGSCSSGGTAIDIKLAPKTLTCNE